MTKSLLSLLTIAVLASSPALACDRHASHDKTPRATEFHGLPGNNPGHGDDNASASPNGTGINGGGGIHGITNVPGQNPDNSPSVGEPGFADQMGTVHGGMGNMPMGGMSMGG